MNFNLGPLLTNSEHWNSCDTMYTEMNGLAYYDSSGNWSSSYSDLECYTDTSINDWLFNLQDNSSFKVDEDSGITC